MKVFDCLFRKNWYFSQLLVFFHHGVTIATIIFLPYFYMIMALNGMDLDCNEQDTPEYIYLDILIILLIHLMTNISYFI